MISIFHRFDACFHRNFLGDVVFHYININFTVFCDDCISGQDHGVAGRIGDEAYFSQHAGLQKTAAVVQCDFHGVCTCLTGGRADGGYLALQRIGRNSCQQYIDGVSDGNFIDHLFRNAYFHFHGRNIQNGVCRLALAGKTADFHVAAEITPLMGAVTEQSAMFFSRFSF